MPVAETVAFEAAMFSAEKSGEAHLGCSGTGKAMIRRCEWR
jgi:hypothetical protein